MEYSDCSRCGAPFSPVGRVCTVCGQEGNPSKVEENGITFSEQVGGLKLKYFVLKPVGKNEYARASRNAMRAYAASIRETDPELAKSLHTWVEWAAKDGE